MVGTFNKPVPGFLKYRYPLIIYFNGIFHEINHPCLGFSGFPMVFLWFSYGFPMVFLWFSYGFSMVFLWFSYIGLGYPRLKSVSSGRRSHVCSQATRRAPGPSTAPWSISAAEFTAERRDCASLCSMVNPLLSKPHDQKISGIDSPCGMKISMKMIIYVLIYGIYMYC